MKKKILALAMAGVMVFGLTACGGAPATTDSAAPAAEAAAPAQDAAAAPEAAAADSGSAEETAPEGGVRNVVYLVNGNLGDKSFFDSAKSGLDELEAAGRIKCTTIEMGGTEEDQPKWLSTLYDVSADGSYDLVICGTFQMPDYLKEVATQYPDQKYLIFDDNTYVGENSNVVNVMYKQNDLGYLVGTFAACMTTDTSQLDKMNPDPVLGFVGGVDSPVINDFLIGFIEGAQKVNPDIKIDTRYTNDYVDTAIAKEYGTSMINDNKCDIIWGVAGNAGNGAAEAALENGGYFIGVDSDQELTFSSDLAAITLTSGLKNIGNSLVWIFDEWDAGRTYFGKEVTLGIAEGGVGLVTDKNYDKFASADTKAKVEEAQQAILNGEITVDSALGDTTGKAEKLREDVRP
ncbi:MAG: BMP family ABC transporter substrate-binding protein [Lachnospiraceae bacterium]|nr:BMP family ABC transporter substrate-binding protein [Lachnospiraceae bacterium]